MSTGELQIGGNLPYECLTKIYRFVDRDMLMRYHFGLGVGHIYTADRRVEPKVVA